jgi:hypothetical protein
MRWSGSSVSSGTFAAVRGHGRLGLELPVACRCADGRILRGVARDISMSGMFIECRDIAKFGSEMSVRAQLPGQSQEVDLHCIVRWARRGAFGVRFESLNHDASTALARLVRELLTSSPPPSGAASG